MSIENRSLLGALLFVGAAQFILVIAITEALYPGVYRGDQLPQRFGRGTNGAFVQRVGRGVRSMSYSSVHCSDGVPSAEALQSPLRSPAPVLWGWADSLKPPGRPTSSSRSPYLSSARSPRSSRIGCCARRSRTSQWASGSSRSLPLS